MQSDDNQNYQNHQDEDDILENQKIYQDLSNSGFPREFDGSMYLGDGVYLYSNGIMKSTKD
jgi:hypothetical protein